jgi:hypothetical protein
MMATLNTLCAIRLNHQSKWKLDTEASSTAPRLIRCLAHISVLSNTSEALLRYHPNLATLGEVYFPGTILGTSRNMNNNFQHAANFVHVRGFLSSSNRSLSGISTRKTSDRSTTACTSDIPILDHLRSEHEVNDASLRQLMEKHKDLMNGQDESDDYESDDDESDDDESDDEDIIVTQGDKLAATLRRIQFREQPTITT